MCWASSTLPKRQDKVIKFLVEGKTPFLEAALPKTPIMAYRFGQSLDESDIRTWQDTPPGADDLRGWLKPDKKAFNAPETMPQEERDKLRAKYFDLVDSLTGGTNIGGAALQLAKLEGNNPAGSVKDRPALSMIKRAEERGEIRPGDVVGFAACGPERESLAAYPGELYAIYLLKEAQGRGLGRAMLETAARHLAEAGHEAWMCWVLADNPTRHFYEAMGGVAFQQKDIEIGGRTLVEVAYGWK